MNVAGPEIDVAGPEMNVASPEMEFPFPGKDNWAGILCPADGAEEKIGNKKRINEDHGKKNPLSLQKKDLL